MFVLLCGLIDQNLWLRGSDDATDRGVVTILGGVPSSLQHFAVK